MIEAFDTARLNFTTSNPLYGESFCPVTTCTVVLAVTLAMRVDILNWLVSKLVFHVHNWRVKNLHLVQCHFRCPAPASCVQLSLKVLTLIAIATCSVISKQTNLLMASSARQFENINSV